jgi:hypothetical protein
MKISTLGLIGAVGLLAGSAFAWQIGSATSKDNILLTRLQGAWMIDMDITSRLDPFGPFAAPKHFEFVRSDKVLAELRNASPRFKSDAIFMGGMMKMDGVEHPFVVENEHGNSHLIILTPERGDIIGSFVAVYICMAPARDPNNDLLFVGGDSPRESAAAYGRWQGK